MKTLEFGKKREIENQKNIKKIFSREKKITLNLIKN